MVFSSSAQTVSISNFPSASSVYSSLTTDQHIADLIKDTTTATSSVWSSSKSVAYFPVINDASASATAVYSSNKVNALIAGIVAQPGFSASVFPYLVDTVTGLNVPNGYLRYDSATQIDSLYLRFSWYDVQAVDVKRFLLATIAPSRIVIFDAGNTNNYQIFEVNGFVTTGVGGGAWVTFPVLFASSGGTGTAGFALNTQIVVGIQSQGINGAQGSPGLSSSLFEYTLDRNSIVIGGGVGSGDIRFNNADLTLATTVWIDHLDTFGNDVERFVGLLADGSQVVIQDKNQSANFAIYDVNSSSIVAGSYIALTVVYVSGANLGTLVNAHPVFLGLQFSVSQTFAVGTVSTLSPGSPATVTNSGTQNDIVLNFGIPQGTAGTNGTNGTNGTDATMDYTFAQFNYYGTVPTASLFNQATGAVSHAGGSLTIGSNNGTTTLARHYHIKSNVSSTANGAVTGWVGTTTGYVVFPGQGFRYVYSFGILDSSTNALTRTFIGISNSSSVFVLNNTATVASIGTQNMGIMQENGEGVFSFYTRGSASSTKVASTIPCTTPTTGWYVLTLSNEIETNDIVMTLTFSDAGTTLTDTHTFTCGTTSTLSTSNACYPLMQRNMSSAGGITGSGTLGLGGMKFWFK